MEHEIYQPEEDSYFLSETLKKEIKHIKDFKKLKYLEIGSGSGIQLQTLKNLKIPNENIFSLDINPEAVKHCKQLGFNCIKSNLFSKIKPNEKYDIIIFNPPYLPDHKFDKKADTSGGKKGSETINKFLIQAKKHLNNKGKIILLTSSFTKGLQWQNYKKKLLAEKSVFFEKLYIYELIL